MLPGLVFGRLLVRRPFRSGAAHGRVLADGVRPGACPADAATRRWEPRVTAKSARLFVQAMIALASTSAGPP